MNEDIANEIDRLSAEADEVRARMDAALAHRAGNAELEETRRIARGFLQEYRAMLADLGEDDLLKVRSRLGPQAEQVERQLTLLA